MRSDEVSGFPGMLLGYARAGTGAPTLEAQIDALTDAGVEPARVYSDVFVAISRMQRRPGFTALLDYARPGDVTVVVGLDRLGRTAPEVMATARDLADRKVGLRSLREGLDTDDPAGSMIVAVLASLAQLDEGLGADHPAIDSSRRHRGSAVGRPRALGDDQIAIAERMRAEGQPVPAIAATLGVSRATLYRTLAERRSA